MFRFRYCYFITTTFSLLPSRCYSWCAIQQHHPRIRRCYCFFSSLVGAASISCNNESTTNTALRASVAGRLLVQTKRQENDYNNNNNNNVDDQYKMFVNDIISFLNVDNISYEYLSYVQLRNVLEERSNHQHQQQKQHRPKQQQQYYYPKQQQQHYSYSIDEIMQLVKQDVFLIIGNSTNSTSNKYVLHLCSIPNLTTMIMSYQQYHHSISNDASSSNGSSRSSSSSDRGSSTSSSNHAVAAHAWLNSQLTNTFSSLSSLSSSSSNDHPYQLSVEVPSSIVHLHYDVWHRSTNIVKSRLRTKCGIYSNIVTTTNANVNANANAGSEQGGRYYARKTIVQQIYNKEEGNSFLINNHLWGSTNYKYAYGLYITPNQKSTLTLSTPATIVVAKKKCNDDDTDQHPTQQPQQLIAMVTFSSGRKVLRSNKPYISYELLRFCTAQDITIVGGLTKLISAFVKDIKKKKTKNNMKEEEGMDIVTSIDRDFGYSGGSTSTWPNFHTVHIMDPIPMFVSSSSSSSTGGGDGIRRHVIGCGLLPLDQQHHHQQQHQQQTRLTNNDNDNAKSNNNLLRAGLPNWLLHRLDERCRNAIEDNDSVITLDDDDTNNNVPTMTTMKKDTTVYDPWQDVAQYGYHPVFDTGVERLMMLVGDDNNINNVATTNGDIPSSSTTMTPMELWDASTPCYAREHYSSNAGVSAMLDCIRSVRN